MEQLPRPVSIGYSLMSAGLVDNEVRLWNEFLRGGSLTMSVKHHGSHSLRTVSLHDALFSFWILTSSMFQSMQLFLCARRQVSTRSCKKIVASIVLYVP